MRWRAFALLLTFVLLARAVSAQPPPASAQPPTAQQPAPPQPQRPQDALGRSTPRGTVLGFLSAARRHDDESARQYLNTRLSGSAAADLTRQLFIVLDTRLPARLPQVSSEPEGSGTFPQAPDQELVGTI